MKIKYQYITFFIMLLCAIIFSERIGFAQEHRVRTREEEAMILKKDIKKRVERNPTWLSYKAFINNDVSICDKSFDGRECWEKVNSYIFLRNIARGNCESLPINHSNATDFCHAISQKNCSDLVGFKKNMCDGVLKKDLSGIKRSYNDISYPEYVSNKTEKAERFLRIYLGFKESSEKACDNFTTFNLALRASCNMLFGNQSYEARLDSISSDLSYAIISKQYEEKNLCKKINNNLIADACIDDSVPADEIIKTFWN